MMSNKKKILFAYPAMMIGGSTTSLLSVLNRLDYNKYDIDLLLNSHTGELLDMIPAKVNLLPPALRYTDKKQEYIHRLLSPKYMYHFWKSKQIAKKTGVAIRAAQYIEMKDVEFFREIPGEYDVAISFLEGDRCKFISRHVNAKKKLAWIHVNYSDAKFEPDYDRDSMALMDRIVLVSEDCKRAFDAAFPELSDRSVIIENVLATEYVQSRAKEQVDLAVDDSKINLVTACRVSFKSKGLDRAVLAMARLKKEGKLNNLAWYIIGEGGDMAPLRTMIEENGLIEEIKLLGLKTNPYPYFNNMSMFFLPSRWEGKPMVVTEAFMMGLPALVTEYSSAREQVRDGVDGIVVENSEQGVYEGLLRIIERPEIIDELKKNVVNTDYSNVEEMEKVVQLIEG